MALGGVRDESEIRGHRRTYIGSMPGKIIQSMKKAKKANPLFLLDEIDKMGNGLPRRSIICIARGSGSGTKQYVLGSLSGSPLMDRMEIIRIAGYTEDEKLEIAKRHLLPKSVKDHALQPKEFSINDEAIRAVIQTYTREAGVRNLERELSKLARKAVTEIMKGNKKTIKVTPKNIDDYLGVPKFRHGEAEKDDQAASYVRSRAVDFGIKPPTFDQVDIHVHVPEGATPKDGPSAGVGMTTAIVSIMTGIPNQGESLRGGITKVLIPEENAKDLADIPDNVKNEMEIVPVSRIDEVLEHALVSKPVAIEWTLEDAERARREMHAPRSDGSATVAH
ncbi:Lon protease [Nymphon striatum]|nr:Lon protease [Nymphon striatum]